MKTIIDQETGEMIQQEIAVKVDRAPSLSIDESDIVAHYFDPQKIVDKIKSQVGFIIYDMNKKSDREACRKEAANIIRCITPIHSISKNIASEAQKKVKQDLSFRKFTDAEIRAIADAVRLPLTEYENEMARIEAEEAAKKQAEEDAKQYLLDWQTAIDYDELFTLRKLNEAAFRQGCDTEAPEHVSRIPIPERLDYPRMVTITVEEHERLLDRDNWLRQLEIAGVEFWWDNLVNNKEDK